MSHKYHISPDVYARACFYHWVFLDLSRDRYSCIRRKDFEQLAPWITLDDASAAAAPQESDANPLLPPPGHIEKELSSLVERGLVTRAISLRGIRPGRRVEPPTEAVIAPPGTSSTILWKMRLLSFCACAARADYLLRHRSLAMIVKRIRARVDRRGPVPFDLDRARTHIAVFNRFRWLYPRDYLCLFDSLALLELLATDRLHPTWVFAVTTDPFQAHCWLQHGTTVLNDTLDRVADYLPIMAV